MATSYTPTVQGSGVKATVQRFGGHLAGMVMPNIGAFIAWGLITAFFIPKGWTPNETIAELVGPMITYLLPILIGYTGGRLVHGQRGAVEALGLVQPREHRARVLTAVLAAAVRAERQVWVVDLQGLGHGDTFVEDATI